MRFTALQVGNIKQGWKNLRPLSSFTFLIQLSIKLGTFHLMISQCHAIIKCKGIHKSQLQSWRRNTFLCHRLERAFFWWPSSMFITTPSPSNTCPVPSRVSAIAPEKKCEMYLWHLWRWQLLDSSQSYRDMGQAGGGWQRGSRGYCRHALTMMDISGTQGPPDRADIRQWGAEWSVNNCPGPAATQWRMESRISFLVIMDLKIVQRL